eukprot:661688-Pelagomonas_calceolata.AAC.3
MAGGTTMRRSSRDAADASYQRHDIDCHHLNYTGEMSSLFSLHTRVGMNTAEPVIDHSSTHHFLVHVDSSHLSP